MASKKQRDIHPLDRIIGANIKKVRTTRGMSMEALGGGCAEPITFQQIQKYESGINRASGSRLAEFAYLLKCDVTVFYEGVMEHLFKGAGAIEIQPVEIDRKDAAHIRELRALPDEAQDAVREMVSGIAKHLANHFKDKGGRRARAAL